MLDKLQERYPAVTWVVVGLLLLGGAFFILRQMRAGAGRDDLGADIVIRFEDTGDETTMSRGRLERTVLEMAMNEAVDPAKGLNNPKTGKPTGFPVNREYWNTIVAGANEVREHSAKSPPPGSQEQQ